MKRTRLVIAVCTALYLLSLTWIILFKGNPGRIDVLFDPDFRTVSLLPVFNAGETLLNAAVFAPLGVLFYLLPETPRFSKQLLLLASVSFFYETAQYALCLGASDVTDLISNTLGGALGLLLCMTAERRCGQRFRPQLSTLACACAFLLPVCSLLLL